MNCAINQGLLEKERLPCYNSTDMREASMGTSGNTKKAYEYIYNQILTGEKSFGAPISEAEIANGLGTSRSPVREALKLLEVEGVIVHYPNRGTFVTDMTREDLSEIFQLRILFELQALRMACQFMDDSILQELRRNIECLNEESTPQQYYSANTALHETIVHYSGNKRLIKFYNTLSLQIALVNRLSAKLPSHFKESRKKHLDIVDAIIQRDSTKAEQLLQSHLEEVRDKTLAMYI